MQLTLEKANDEIISLKEAKNYLRIDHNFDDDLLNTLIRATREVIESKIQKSIMAQTWKYTVNKDDFCSYSGANAIGVVMSYDTIMIPLPKPPVVCIKKAEINGKEVNKTCYSLEKINSRVYLRLECKNTVGEKSKFPITITYESGISNKMENVPHQLKLSNLMLVADAYQERYSPNKNTVISEGIRQLLGKFLELRIS
jgi:uncharacterized phiE125 gp8 family phage protein